jgi:hypothetical protein
MLNDLLTVLLSHSYKYYERWATSIGLAKANVLNCGVR